MFVPAPFRRSGAVDPQTGQPPVAATATGPGTPAYRPREAGGPWRPLKLFGGFASWRDPGGKADLQRGQPVAFAANQRVARRQVPIAPQLPAFVHTPYYDGGAAMFAPQFETAFTNPIGGGVEVTSGNHASYYPSGQYEAGMVFWTNQFVPTSIPTSELNSAAEMEAILADFHVYQAIEVAP